MEFVQIITEGITVKQAYRQKNQTDGHQPWATAEYLQGFVGDVGDLTKLIMAKNNFRHHDNINEKIAHELADCLWSVIVLADELGVDLEKEFLSTMSEIKQKLDAETSSPD